MTENKIVIKNGRVIDPANKRDGIFDILVDNGLIAKIGHGLKTNGVKIIDAKDKIVTPGLIDIHVHLREPGREDEETILTGGRAAVKGGFTAICCMPNTTPSCDDQATVKFIIDTAKKHHYAKVYPIGAITKKREGKELSEIAELKASGCVGLSDDGDSVLDAALMRRALEYASSFDLPILAHCEDKALSEGGSINEGFVSTVLGLKAIPNKAESIIIERDLALAALAGAHIHIAHVSTREGVWAIRQARQKGVRVSAEATPHHLALTDACARTFDTNTKVNPPLRTEDDVAALKAGLKDGTIDIIASDHAPHLESEKDVEYDQAPFGMIGLETSFAVVKAELIDKKILSWPELIAKMTVNPARMLGLPLGTLSETMPADITVIDPDEEWIYTRDSIVSKSRNSPFLNRHFKGRVTGVIVDGRIVVEHAAMVRL
ncbi:MAG: dihydroorotase [Candidatus Omnitrophica bacterium]|nr:dihydroorotase [Candidatus Omnitrophota bacterium]